MHSGDKAQKADAAVPGQKKAANKGDVPHWDHLSFQEVLVLSLPCEEYADLAGGDQAYMDPTELVVLLPVSNCKMGVP